MGWALKDREKLGGKGWQGAGAGDGDSVGQGLEVSWPLSVYARLGHTGLHAGNLGSLSLLPSTWQPAREPPGRLVGKLLTRRWGQPVESRGSYLLGPPYWWVEEPPTNLGFWSRLPSQPAGPLPVSAKVTA